MNLFKYLILGLILLITACSEPIKVDKLDEGSIILAFGDSLTYGFGAGSIENSYPSKLQNITGYSVINAGLNGDTASNGRYRIVDVVEEYNPDLVIVGIGGNDMLRNQDKQLENNLSKIVEYLLEQKIDVVLLAEPQPSMTFMITSLSDAEVYKNVAKKYNIPVISDVYSNYLSDNKYKSDTIHLNSDGYELVAKDIAESLREFGYID